MESIRWKSISRTAYLTNKSVWNACASQQLRAYYCFTKNIQTLAAESQNLIGDLYLSVAPPLRLARHVLTICLNTMTSGPALWKTSVWLYIDDCKGLFGAFRLRKSGSEHQPFACRISKANLGRFAIIWVSFEHQTDSLPAQFLISIERTFLSAYVLPGLDKTCTRHSLYNKANFSLFFSFSVLCMIDHERFKLVHSMRYCH